MFSTCLYCHTDLGANESIPDFPVGRRLALAGELRELREAWKEAEEIAAIADDMFAGETLEEFKRQYYLRLRTEG
jgi:hypothetical protein